MVAIKDQGRNDVWNGLEMNYANRRKAFLAIAFTGGLLNSQLPAPAENKVHTTNSLMQRIANSTQMPAEVRAFYLLKLAYGYLSDSNKGKAEAQYASVGTEQDGSHNSIARRWDAFLIPWTEQILVEGLSANHNNAALADAAIQKAVSQLDNSSNKSAKLKMYFIASLLFEKAGDTDGVKKCAKLLEETFQACERNSPTDEDERKGAISVLNLMSYCLIPVQISDFDPKLNPMKPQQVKQFTDKDFKESEKFRLRAVGIADRLPTQNHVRRKAHRDLTLWYMQLGKNELAEKQKQVLFELVGYKDDSVLYPQHEGCGQVVWWKKEKLQSGFDCGRG